MYIIYRVHHLDVHHPVQRGISNPGVCQYPFGDSLKMYASLLQHAFFGNICNHEVPAVLAFVDSIDNDSVGLYMFKSVQSFQGLACSECTDLLCLHSPGRHRLLRGARPI